MKRQRVRVAFSALETIETTQRNRIQGQQKMLHAVQWVQWVGMPLVCRQLIHENRRKVEDLTAGGKPCFLNNTGDVNLKSLKSPQWRPSYGGREHLSLQSVEFVSDQ